MKSTHIAQNRYSAPLSEKAEDELLLAIRKGQSDTADARAELAARGIKTTEAHADTYRFPTHELAVEARAGFMAQGRVVGRVENVGARGECAFVLYR